MPDDSAIIKIMKIGDTEHLVELHDLKKTKRKQAFFLILDHVSTDGFFPSCFFLRVVANVNFSKLNEYGLKKKKDWNQNSMHLHTTHLIFFIHNHPSVKMKK